MACLQRGNAAMSRLEELTRIPQHVPKGLAGLSDFFQVGGEAVDEFQRRKLPLDR